MTSVRVGAIGGERRGIDEERRDITILTSGFIPYCRVGRI